MDILGRYEALFVIFGELQAQDFCQLVPEDSIRDSNTNEPLPPHYVPFARKPYNTERIILLRVFFIPT